MTTAAQSTRTSIITACNLAKVCRGLGHCFVDNVNLFARVDVLCTHARLTFDVAAPLKAALAALGDAPSLSVVAAAATYLVAVVGVARARLTSTTVSPDGAGHLGRVRLAVVRRWIDVDQIVRRRTTPTNAWRAPTTVTCGLSLILVRHHRGRYWIQRCTVRVERHLASAVITTPQPAADLPECWQLVPTGASAARSRNTVALARCFRIAVDRLSHRHHYTGLNNCRNGSKGRQGNEMDPQLNGY